MQTPLASRIQRARSSFERRDYQSALADARAVLAEAPAYADLRNLAGLCLCFLGEPAQAIAEFDAALSLNNRYIEAHLNRAITLNELGRYQEARDAFARASFLESDGASQFRAGAAARLANAHAGVGDLYVEAAAPNAAVEQYRRALELRPHFHDIRNRLAVALIHLGRLDDAEVELRRVLDGNERFIAARLNLGLVLLRMDRRDEARVEWERCREQQPANPQVRAYLALLAAGAGEGTQSVETA
jgi:tetratricopeptide (TPR) repeat protein